MTFFRTFSLAIALLYSSVNAAEIDVYTEILPPFQLIESEKVTGIATEKVKQLLDEVFLSYELHVVPWPRAFNIVKTTPNTLIYSMNRTPEREPYFQWIGVVAQISNSFISLTSSNLKIDQLEEAKAYVTAVVRDGYAHSTLLEQGFVKDENMYVVATLEQQISLILKGKIDFLFTDIQTVRHALNLQNRNPELVRVSYSQPNWTRDLYLAANINTNPKIVKLLNTQFDQFQH